MRLGTTRHTALGRAAIKDLAARHGIRPRKSLGQHFLVDPNAARRIVKEAGVGPGEYVLEVGAGFGSLTLPLAAAGAHVVAVEADRRLAGALREVTAPWPAVEVIEADATLLDWEGLLERRRWKMVSNLPYNAATNLLLGMLERKLPVAQYVVTVQREVGERLVAPAGSPSYGAVSLRVAYFAKGELLRRIPRTVFWPEPSVESVLCRLVPRCRPPVTVGEARLFAFVDRAFAQRRKTIRSAVRRAGVVDRAAAEALLEACGVDPARRPEELSLEEFARVAEAVP